MDPASVPLTAFQKRRQKVKNAIPIISDLVVAQIFIETYAPHTWGGLKTPDWNKMARRWLKR